MRSLLILMLFNPVFSHAPEQKETQEVYKWTEDFVDKVSSFAFFFIFLLLLLFWRFFFFIKLVVAKFIVVHSRLLFYVDLIFRIQNLDVVDDPDEYQKIHDSCHQKGPRD